MHNVLVTGSQGFVGHHLVRLLSLNYNVIGYDNLDKLGGGRIDEGDKFIEADIRDIQALETAIKANNISRIIHLAAYARNLTCQDHAKAAIEINIIGSLNILEMAKKFRLRTVLCSSNITLSDQPTIYKTSKLAVEELTRLYASSYNVNCLALRPSNIAGTGQSSTEYQKCCFIGLNDSLKANGYISISGDGTQTRDFINAKDVSRAFLLALESNYTGETLDICSGIQVSLNEIADMLAVPIGYVAARPGDAHSLISDPSLAKKILGFEAKVGIEETIKESFPDIEF